MNLWIVGKHILKTEEGHTAWEFIGVYDSIEKAITACTQDSYFCGPALLNETLPDEPSVWLGAFYPTLQSRP